MSSYDVRNTKNQHLKSGIKKDQHEITEMNTLGTTFLNDAGIYGTK